MSKEQKKTPAPDSGPVQPEEQAGAAPQEQAAQAKSGQEPEAGAKVQEEKAAETFTVTREQMEKMEGLAGQLAALNDQHLRLMAEYDNYRKRTAREKESLWADVKADTAAAFLPVYDNLERALKQGCSDEAFRKGVEMTMNQLKEVLSKLGLTEIPALGQPFDPKLHNAVMHVEDENLGENVVAEVFQAGFMLGEKVIRFAMVKVAN